MNDDELRLLIRAAIARHMSAEAGTVRLKPDAPKPDDPGTLRLRPDATVSLSFGQYRLDRASGDTMCIIEPAVQCNHCGFCKCHGH